MNGKSSKMIRKGLTDMYGSYTKSKYKRAKRAYTKLNNNAKSNDDMVITAIMGA